jgi:hypothetical protein
MEDEGVFLTISSYVSGDRSDHTSIKYTYRWGPNHRRLVWNGRSGHQFDLDRAVKNARRFAKKHHKITPIVTRIAIEESITSEAYINLTLIDESQVDENIADEIDIYCDPVGRVVEPIIEIYDSHDQLMETRGGRYAKKVGSKKSTKQSKAKGSKTKTKKSAKKSTKR